MKRDIPDYTLSTLHVSSSLLGAGLKTDLKLQNNLHHISVKERKCWLDRGNTIMLLFVYWLRQWESFEYG